MITADSKELTLHEHEKLWNGPRCLVGRWLGIRHPSLVQKRQTPARMLALPNAGATDPRRNITQMQYTLAATACQGENRRLSERSKRLESKARIKGGTGACVRCEEAGTRPSARVGLAMSVFTHGIK